MFRAMMVFTGLVALAAAGRLQATIVWQDSYYQILDGDTYDTDLIVVSPPSGQYTVVDVFGGVVDAMTLYESGTLNTYGGKVGLIMIRSGAELNMHHGEVHYLHVYTGGDANLRGGTIPNVSFDGGAIVNLYAYDVTFSPDTPASFEGCISGRWYADDTMFTIHLDAPSWHDRDRISIIPEPAAVLLLGLGGLALRNRGSSANP